MARVGKVEDTGDRPMPFRLLDGQGVEVPAVTEFLHHMLVDVAWHLAGRVEARDFALWLKITKKPATPVHLGVPDVRR